MRITKEDVEHVASLARLRFDEDELERYTLQLNDILTYVDQLNEVDTSDVRPTTHALELFNVFRGDSVAESLPTEKALSNAPHRSRGSFQVHRVIE